MAVTGRSERDLAATLTDAGFVRVAPRADGDSIAAAGLLLRALAARSTPFQARVVPLTDDLPADATVPIGFPEEFAPDDRPASAAAADLVRELDCEPDPGLALAGCLLGGDPEAAGVDLDRRSGVGIPTADLADGLAHSTLFHADFSGDETAVGAHLAELADDDRAVASLAALDAVGSEAASDRAATAIERALRPHATPEGPFETAEGLADVLDCLARDAPGVALALAMGHDTRLEALDAWRTHATAAHDAIRGADTGRYDGLFVARINEGPVATVARLLRDFRSPEPVVLVVADDEAGAAGFDGVGEAMAEAGVAVDGMGGGTPSRGVARFDCPPEAFLEAFRGAMA
ncbi:exonuclease RecJ [Halalkalicoccus sp. NIPERK01]|uniref:exonuclease RecJ n=1 Tax=Halalkalicoccus sp. NIPERK01 TaxID=3053469 RepID=UPI00256F105B|nr:exonuclease RecJ [Halalkalicoccus sp. NIPERK01]MDL5360517.1 exonuclease RecJ [Halalkalicoccus sp. NIPERK01]